jgi:hypothetical protein
MDMLIHDVFFYHVVDLLKFSESELLFLYASIIDTTYRLLYADNLALIHPAYLSSDGSNIADCCVQQLLQMQTCYATNQDLEIQKCRFMIPLQCRICCRGLLGRIYQHVPLARPIICSG